jgi:hypothetical protein
MSEQEESATTASQDAPLTDEEKQARIREALARLEIEHENNTASTPRLSKQFWYAVFGLVFFAFMAMLCLWAWRDLRR